MRIVSLAPSNTEILYRLGVEDQIVATTSLCNHPVEAARKSSVGGWTDIEIERVNEFDPDIAFASDDLQNQIVESLRDSGTKVVQVKPHTLEEVYQSIERIGESLGRKNNAQEIVKEMRERINSVNLKGKRIYCEEWMEPPMVSGNWIPGLIKAGNGEYFVEEGKRSREYKLDDLKDFNPEYIFLNVCGAGKNADLEKLSKRERWQQITALKKNNVYVVDDALLNRPGPRLVDGLEKICKNIRR